MRYIFEQIHTHSVIRRAYNYTQAAPVYSTSKPRPEHSDQDLRRRYNIRYRSLNHIQCDGRGEYVHSPRVLSAVQPFAKPLETFGALGLPPSEYHVVVNSIRLDIKHDVHTIFLQPLRGHDRVVHDQFRITR